MHLPAGGDILFWRWDGMQRSGSAELINVANAAITGDKILAGWKRAELNSALVLVAPRGSCGLRNGRRLGTSFHGLRRPGDNVGKQGQDAKIECRHAFLLNRLHLQGIIPDRAGPRGAVGNDAEE